MTDDLRMPDPTVADLALRPLARVDSEATPTQVAAALRDARAETALVLRAEQPVGLIDPATLIGEFAADAPPRPAHVYATPAPPVIVAHTTPRAADATMQTGDHVSLLVRDADGNWLGLLSRAALMRARQRAEGAHDLSVRHREASLRTLIDTIPDLIWLKDADGYYLACNRQFERFYGAAEADIIGRNDYDFVAPEVADAFRHNDQAAARLGGPRHNEELLTYPDNGEQALMDTTKTPIFADDGELLGVLGIGHDITRLRAAEASLRRDASYQRALLDNFPFLVWLKDTESRFLAVNLPFARAAAREQAADLVGRTDHDIWPKELAEAYVADDREVMRSREKRYVEEDIVIDNERRWHATYKAPVTDADGALLGTVGFAMDITERKHREQESARQLEELLSWRRATLGRETRVLELKREINELLIERGLPARYPSALEGAAPAGYYGADPDTDDPNDPGGGGDKA